jgi:hypothetical protein
MTAAQAEPRPRSKHTVECFAENDGVVYTPRFGPLEDGVVTSVNNYVVFVRYKAAQVNGTATYAYDLFFPDERKARCSHD